MMRGRAPKSGDRADGDPLRHLRRDEPFVALTFDDGPDPRHTPPILDVLAEHQARATFFVIGRAAVAHPGLVRRIIDEGHALGNHGWSHRHAWSLSEAGARREVAEASGALREISGRPPAFFRPPHGRVRRNMTEEARRHGQAIVLWSRSAIDWGPFGSPHGVARRLRRVRAGDVVLMHDGKNRFNRPASTLEALPGLLALIGARGLGTALLSSPSALDGGRSPPAHGS